MRQFRNIGMAALLGLSLVGLAGCDAAEQSARDLASQAEQAAQALARETLKESVNALNEQLDQAQEKTEAWLQPPPPPPANTPDESEAPEAADSVAPIIQT